MTHDDDDARHLPFSLPGPHGLLVATAVDRTATREELLARLHPEEAALAVTWGELRVRTFVAGRLALREAIAGMGGDLAGPILRDPRGAPLLPAGLRASVSHKDRVAAALVSMVTDRHIGVDVEELEVEHGDVARHVLTEAERAELADIEDERERRRELLLRFSLKEALYKALDPIVQRYVGFLEVEVRPTGQGTQQGTAEIAFRLTKGEGPFITHARWLRRGSLIFTSVQLHQG